MAKKEELTPEEFEALARQLGLLLRPGAAPEMARAYALLQEFAERVRAASKA